MAQIPYVDASERVTVGGTAPSAGTTALFESTPSSAGDVSHAPGEISIPSLGSNKGADMDRIPPNGVHDEKGLSIGGPSDQDERDSQGPVTPLFQPSTARLIAMSAAATGTMVISSMGTSALNIALPTMKDDLKLGQDELEWIPSAYTLTFGCFLLLSGRLADVFGRKKVLLVGLFWYALWTLVGPAIKSGIGFIVSRALAGIGAALA